MTPYTYAQRLAHIEQFLSAKAEEGPVPFERTVSRHIATTYGGGMISEDDVKRIKARFRNELSTPGEDK